MAAKSLQKKAAEEEGNSNYINNRPTTVKNSKNYHQFETDKEVRDRQEARKLNIKNRGKQMRETKELLKEAIAKVKELDSLLDSYLLDIEAAEQLKLDTKVKELEEEAGIVLTELEEEQEIVEELLRMLG